MIKLWSMGLSVIIVFPLYGILQDMRIGSFDSFYITTLVWLNLTVLSILLHYFEIYIIKEWEA